MDPFLYLNIKALTSLPLFWEALRSQEADLEPHKTTLLGLTKAETCLSLLLGTYTDGDPEYHASPLCYESHRGFTLITGFHNLGYGRIRIAADLEWFEVYFL